MTPDEGRVVVDGCSIHFLRWGTRGKPGLVLIHGGAAHAQWWAFLAPMLTATHDVIAVDLAGHGDSDWRRQYSLEQWARDVMAVIAEAKFPGAPVVIGHSLGGLVTIALASLFGPQLAGAVVVDSAIQAAPNPDEPPRAAGTLTNKVYATLEIAMPRFRLLPKQPSEHAYILQYIARTSLKVEGGWSWKFDPHVFLALELDQLTSLLKTVKCRMAVMRGDHSGVLSPQMARELYELLGGKAPLIEIPQSHHHLMLDHPLAFISAARTLLADWEHSRAL